MAAKSDSGIVWEEPPATTGHRTTISAEMMAELKANPGQWGKVKQYENPGSCHSAASQIRRGKANGFTKGEWEAKAAANGDGAWLYVRFVGGKQ